MGGWVGGCVCLKGRVCALRSVRPDAHARVITHTRVRKHSCTHTRAIWEQHQGADCHEFDPIALMIMRDYPQNVISFPQASTTSNNWSVKGGKFVYKPPCWLWRKKIPVSKEDGRYTCACEREESVHMDSLQVGARIAVADRGCCVWGEHYDS